MPFNPFIGVTLRQPYILFVIYYKKDVTLKHLACISDILQNAVLTVYTFQKTVLLTVCFYHVTYVFQSECTLCSCLNVKELLARNRHNISSLSDYNRTRTRND